MQAFDFTEEDLDANRHGYMSKKQRVRLRKNSRWALKYLTRLALRLSIVIIAPTLLIKILLPADNETLILVLVMSSCIAGFILFIMVLVIVPGNGEMIDHDLEKGDVTFVCGQAFLDVPDTEKGKNPRRLHLHFQFFYSLEVNGVRFLLTERYWAALLNLDRRPICVYYTLNARAILSIEESTGTHGNS